MADEIPETLVLTGRRHPGEADSTWEMVARDRKQETEVRFLVSREEGARLWDALLARARAFVPNEVIVTPTPEQVTVVRTVEWHEYRRGMPARNE